MSSSQYCREIEKPAAARAEYSVFSILRTPILFLKPIPEVQIFYGWNTKKEAGFYLNQVSFSNWNAGGTNSISGISSIAGMPSDRPIPRPAMPSLKGLSDVYIV